MYMDVGFPSPFWPRGLDERCNRELLAYLCRRWILYKRNVARVVFGCLYLGMRSGDEENCGVLPESSKVANAYRGELLGLMAIHLILLAANKVWPTLQGQAKVYSDCLGAL